MVCIDGIDETRIYGIRGLRNISIGMYEPRDESSKTESGNEENPYTLSACDIAQEMFSKRSHALN